jgi:hypothetical protein
VIVAGIDYSTTGANIILLSEESPVRRVCSFKRNGNSFDRARGVRAAMPLLASWKQWEVQAIGIEEPRGHGNGSLHRVQGAILACLPPDLLVEPFVPSAWRKLAGMSGGASKDQVKAFVRTREDKTRVRYWTQDDCDAYCIALAVRASALVVDSHQ